MKYGGFRFMEAAHVKDVLAPLHVVANPSDDLALGRALLRCHGIGRVGARKLQAAAVGAATANEVAAAVRDNARGKSKENIRPLLDLLDALALAQESPAECIRLSVEYYAPILEERFDDWPKRRRDRGIHEERLDVLHGGPREEVEHVLFVADLGSAKAVAREARAPRRSPPSRRRTSGRRRGETPHGRRALRRRRSPRELR